MTRYIVKNPIISGFYPDPSICKSNDGYYLVCSSFEYFPGVPIFFSENLFSWKQIGYCLTDEIQLDLKEAKASDGIYAPTIRYNNGIFYMITTNINLNKHLLVTNENPKAENWSNPIFIEQEGIDPSLFFDDDGKVYLTTSGNQRIVQSAIDIKTGKKLTDEKVIWHGTGFRFPEGPHIYKIKGVYYLLISEGGTEYNHMVTIARSKSIWGEFKSCPHNPILSHAGKINDIQATGHADITQDLKGNWFMVALGIRPNGYPPVHHLGRETFLIPFHFNQDNWPQIKNKEIPMEIPVEYDCLDSDKNIEDNFINPVLQDWWNFLRFSNKDSYTINTERNSLSLKCLKADINSTDMQSFLGMRQRHFDCTFETILEFFPQNKECAGICVRMNETHYYLLHMSQKDNKNVLTFTRRIGSLVADEKQIFVKDNNIKLVIRATADTYSFYYKSGEENTAAIIGKGETRYLSTEVAKGFTGVYFGLYASSNSIKSENLAEFFKVKYSVN